MPIAKNKLFSLHLHDKENLYGVKSIDIWFQSRKLLTEATWNVSDILNFRLDCQNLLVKMTENISEYNSPQLHNYFYSSEKAKGPYALQWSLF